MFELALFGKKRSSIRRSLPGKSSQGKGSQGCSENGPQVIGRMRNKRDQALAGKHRCCRFAAFLII